MAPQINLSDKNIIALGLLFLLPFIRPKSPKPSKEKVSNKVVRTNTSEIRVELEENCDVDLNSIMADSTGRIYITINVLDVLTPAKAKISMTNITDKNLVISGESGPGSNWYSVVDGYYVLGIPIDLAYKPKMKIVFTGAIWNINLAYRIDKWIDYNTALLQEWKYHIIYWGKTIETLWFQLTFKLNLPCSIQS